MAYIAIKKNHKWNQTLPEKNNCAMAWTFPLEIRSGVFGLYRRKGSSCRKRKLERVWPSLHGMFTEIPQPEPQLHGGDFPHLRARYKANLPHPCNKNIPPVVATPPFKAKKGPSLRCAQKYDQTMPLAELRPVVYRKR